MSLVHKMASQYPEVDLLHPCEREYQAYYRAYLFGQFRVFRENLCIGEQIQRRSKAGTLLKWFLLNPGRPVSADEFLDLFWPEISAETALGNLHVTMHHLRHLLQPELRARQKSRFIHRQSNNFYWFEMSKAWWSDSVEIQQLFDTACLFDQADSSNKASFYYRKVISTCHPGLLEEDASEEWLAPYRRNFRQIHVQALQRMIQISMQKDELEEVMEYAYQALAIDPYCEPAIKAIINVYLQEGNVILASRKFNDFWNFFQRTLGIEPSRDFYLLRERIIEATG
jgi:DNA-binding SARP family transcriptional activator